MVLLCGVLQEVFQQVQGRRYTCSNLAAAAAAVAALPGRRRDGAVLRI